SLAWPVFGHSYTTKQTWAGYVSAQGDDVVVKELKHRAASLEYRGEVEGFRRRATPTIHGHQADGAAPLYTLYTGGVCRQESGPGGWAYVEVVNDQEREESGDDVATTHTRMELTAAIKGLQSTGVGSTVLVYTASQAVQQGMATF